MESSEFIKVFVALLAIVNPIGAIPLFLTLTDGQNSFEQHRIIKVATVSLFVIMMVALLVGEFILQFFGIEVPSFRIAGGILILLMSLSMLQGKRSDTKTNDHEKSMAAEKESIAVVPLSIPLLGGPGAISTLILLSHEYHSFAGYLFISLAILVVCLFTFTSLLASPAIAHYVGRPGINIMTRVMGLLLASTAVEFISKGILEIFPGLR